MAERRCGYCRQFGHNAGKCNVKMGQIKAARLHVGQQRRQLAELLTLNGFGVGALVNAYVYSVGENVPCIVTQNSLDSLGSLHLVEYFNVKYSKCASVRLYNYNGVIATPDDGDVTNVFRTSLYLSVTPMQNGLRDTHATVHVSDLPIGPNNLKSEIKRGYSWDRHAELLAPSHDGAISETALNMPFHLSPRLGGGFVTPLFL